MCKQQRSSNLASWVPKPILAEVVCVPVRLTLNKQLLCADNDAAMPSAAMLLHGLHQQTAELIVGRFQQGDDDDDE